MIDALLTPRKLSSTMSSLFTILIVLNCIILCNSTLTEDHKVIIAHRGASAYAPEHSLVAYTLAMELQSHYIEPDLLLTKDNHFIAMHDLIIDNVTNIIDHPEFFNRYTTKKVPNKRGVLEDVAGYFVDDFTLNEIKSLRLRQRGRWKERHHNLDDIFTVPTLNEIAQLVKSKHEQQKLLQELQLKQNNQKQQYSTNNNNNHNNDDSSHINYRDKNSNNHAHNKTETQFGMYIELKHPDYYAMKGIQVGQMLLNELKNLGFQTRYNDTTGHYSIRTSSVNDIGDDSGIIPSPIVIQTFDPSTLEHLSQESDIPLVQLIEPHDEGADLSILQWSELKNRYNSKLSGVGIDKNSLTALSLKSAQSHIAAIHEAGMVVHSYTSRADHYDGIAKHFNHSFYAETMYLFCCLNVDGIFIEQPDIGREYSSTLRAQTQEQGHDSDDEFSKRNLNGCPITCEDFQPDTNTVSSPNPNPRSGSTVSVMIDINRDLSDL